MKDDRKWRFWARVVACVDLARASLASLYVLVSVIKETSYSYEDTSSSQQQGLVAEHVHHETEIDTSTKLAHSVGALAYTLLQMWFSYRLIKATELGIATNHALWHTWQYYIFSLIILIIMGCCPVLVASNIVPTVPPLWVWIFLMFWLLALLERVLYLMVVHNFLKELRQRCQLLGEGQHPFSQGPVLPTV